jgi:hypothetical protein
MRTRTGSVFRFLLLFLIAFLFVPLLSAFTSAQPQPDPAAKIRVESVEVNLTQHPAFQFVVAIPAVLRFEAGDAAGVRYLHIWHTHESTRSTSGSGRRLTGSIVTPASSRRSPRLQIECDLRTPVRHCEVTCLLIH